MRTRSLVPTALLLCGCSFHHAPVAPEPVRGPARDSLFQFDEARGDSVARRGPVDAMFALIDPEAVLLRPGIPAVYGRDNIRAVLAADPAPAATTWQPLGGNVSDDLHSGYTYGVVARPDKSKSQVRLERYIAYWHRATGKGTPWQIAAYLEVGAPSSAEVALPPAASQPSPPILPKPLDDARTKVHEADSLFADLAYRMGVGFAFSNTADQNGVIFGNPSLVVGPNAIRDYYASRPEVSLAWKPVFASVAESADLGFTVGEYINTIRGPTGAAVQRYGKYLTIWKRQKDGTWKFLVDGGNPTATPTDHR
jgi:hypothetical protein